MDIREIITKEQPYNSNNLNMPKSFKVNANLLCTEYNATTANDGEKRKEILQKLFGTCHELTFIEPPFRCDYGFNIHTHGLTVINYNCVILDTSPVNIGENVFIAPGVCIACAGHSIDPRQRAEGISTSKPINIGNDVWIGANATICPGVTIGNGTVIGAGSVVVKDIPSGVVAAGNPCKVIRKITDDDRIQDEDIIF